jgi:hypothetical protein
MSQINCLENNIKVLLEKGVNLLKARLFELGIKAATSHELLNKAKEIVAHNKDLQLQESALQNQIIKLENDYYKLSKKSHRSDVSNSNHFPNGFRTDKRSNILTELTAMLEQKKQLSSKVSQLEDEVQYLEKSQLTISNKSRALDLPPKSSLQSVSHSGVIVTNDNYSTKIHDFEDRIKSMIIQALNEKPPFPTLNSHRKYDQNLSQEIKNNKRKEKNEENSTQMSNENDNACDTNWRQSDGKLKNRCNDNFGALYNNEHQSPKNHSTKKTSEKIHDKKPLLMTLKIDRKANSAVVKECNSPNDSHSRTNDVKYKRKSNSDEMHSSRKK